MSSGTTKPYPSREYIIWCAISSHFQSSFNMGRRFTPVAHLVALGEKCQEAGARRGSLLASLLFTHFLATFNKKVSRSPADLEFSSKPFAAIKSGVSIAVSVFLCRHSTSHNNCDLPCSWDDPRDCTLKHLKSAAVFYLLLSQLQGNKANQQCYLPSHALDSQPQIPVAGGRLIRPNHNRSAFAPPLAPQPPGALDLSASTRAAGPAKTHSDPSSLSSATCTSSRAVLTYPKTDPQA